VVAGESGCGGEEANDDDDNGGDEDENDGDEDDDDCDEDDDDRREDKRKCLGDFGEARLATPGLLPVAKAGIHCDNFWYLWILCNGEDADTCLAS